MKAKEVIQALGRQTRNAAFVECLPVSLLFGDTSTTYLGGEAVPPSAKYPTRAQFKIRAKVAALVGCSMGDFEAIDRHLNNAASYRA